MGGEGELAVDATLIYYHPSVEATTAHIVELIGSDRVSDRVDRHGEPGVHRTDPSAPAAAAPAASVTENS
jgi:hypothetical protein